MSCSVLSFELLRGAQFWVLNFEFWVLNYRQSRFWVVQFWVLNCLVHVSVQIFVFIFLSSSIFLSFDFESLSFDFPLRFRVHLQLTIQNWIIQNRLADNSKFNIQNSKFFPPEGKKSPCRGSKFLCFVLRLQSYEMLATHAIVVEE